MRMKRLLLYLFLVFITSGLHGQPGSLYTIQLDQPLPSFLRYQPDDAFPMVSAHRGGRYLPGYPENALETFEFVLARTPALIECDVSMTRDSVLFLLHDSSLERTTTGTGKVSDQTWEEIKDLSLLDDFGDTTTFRIPRLRKVLDWAVGKAILTVDVKRGVPFDRVVDEIEAARAENYAVVIVYNVRDAVTVHQLNPDLMISVSIRNQEELERVEEAGLPYDRLIAFTGTRLADPALYEALHRRGILCILGTLGNLDRMAQARGPETYRTFIEKGADILATDFPVTTAQILRPLIPADSERAQYFYRKN